MSSMRSRRATFSSRGEQVRRYDVPMRSKSTRRALAWALVLIGLVLGTHAGCDEGGGGLGTSSASCSSCQEAFAAEDCKTWGDLAGCEEATVLDEGTCAEGLAGCAFKNCKGAPICNDEGTSTCASCSRDLTQADCDAIAETAGCSSATTNMLSACGHDAVGCDFVGCDFEPSCE